MGLDERNLSLVFANNKVSYLNLLQANFASRFVGNPEGRFCRDEAHSNPSPAICVVQKVLSAYYVHCIYSMHSGLILSSKPILGTLAQSYKFSSCSTQLSTKFQLLIKLKYQQMKKFLALSLSDVVFIMLINVKMLTIVGILTFMSRINLVLN